MIPHVDDPNKTGAEELEYYDNEKTNNISWKDQLLLNGPLKVIIVLLLASTLSPLLIYYYIFFESAEIPPSDGFSFGSCLLPRESRVPCGLGLINESDCHPQCCYDLDNNFCFHRFPSRFTYLVPTDQAWNDTVKLTPRLNTVPYKFQQSLPQITLSVNEVSSTHLTLLFNSEQPEEIRKVPDKTYTYEISSSELNILVNRTENNNVIFNTNGGPIIASENIWEIAFILTKESMYGFGEIPLKLSDKLIYNYAGGLNSIPIIFAKSGDQYHGLLIDVYEPTELKIQEDNQIVVRSITNNGLKFHIFLGPEPKDIMKDVTDYIGFTTKLEYWMLGPHICSEFSEDSQTSFKNLEEFLIQYSKEHIPFDSHCGTKAIVFENEPMSSDRLQNEGELLKEYEKRFVPLVSPYIVYDNANETEVQQNETVNEITSKKLVTEAFKEFMLRKTNGEMYVGEIKNLTYVYPDYGSATVEFMKQLWQSDMEIDGIVLENSWPTDDSIKQLDEMYEALPYFNKNFETAFEVTPLWNIEGNNGTKHLYAHNLYGNEFAEAFSRMFTRNLPTWSSSQWMNGKVSVNQQHVETSWASLQAVLISAALGGISGQRFWSSPICGDTDFDPTTQTNLCTKWYMAGVYLPVIKIHSKEVATHPLAFTGTNKKYITKALHHRMTLLPYFYTTLQDGPLLKPMFYQFPSSRNLNNLASQFSVGDALLIVPNLLPSQSHVNVWLPPGTWYELWSGFQLEGNEGDPVTMTTTEADLLTLIRGGTIVPLQKNVKLSAESTRLQSDLTLIIALECTQNQTLCVASGYLFIETDLSIVFEADSEGLTIESNGTNYEHICTDEAVSTKLIKDIQIYGLLEELNNYDHHRKVTIDTDLCILETVENIRVKFV